MVLGDRSEVTNSSRKGRKQATSFAPGGRSFSIPIHALGQPSKPRQYRSSNEDEAGTLRIIVEVFTDVCFRAMELITILNRCHHFRGFVYHQARFTSDYKSIEISIGRASVPPPSARAAISPHLATINSPSGASSSSPSGYSLSSWCTPCDASIAAAAAPSWSKKSPGGMANTP